jgi:hypothetical protein
MPVTIKNSVALNGRIQFDSPWSPHLLFTAPGVWYDPSDYSTLYIGRCGNASIPLNGRIYQLIVCGKALSAHELTTTEAYVAPKTGVTI